MKPVVDLVDCAAMRAVVDHVVVNFCLLLWQTLTLRAYTPAEEENALVIPFMNDLSLGLLLRAIHQNAKKV